MLNDAEYDWAGFFGAHQDFRGPANGMGLIHGLAALDPSDHDMAELQQIMQAQIAGDIAAHAGDPLYANTPPTDVSLPVEGCVWLGYMSNGRPLSFPTAKAAGGTVISGLPGCGKTTFAMILTVSLVLTGVLVVVWDTKRTWRKLLDSGLLLERIILLSVNDLAWSLLQPPPHTSLREWINRFVKVLAQVYGRISAQRLLRHVIDQLLAVCPRGCWPTPEMLIHQLETFKTKNAREKEYVASTLWVLHDLVAHLPESFHYTSSDFVQKLYGQGGRLIIIEDEGLPIPHWNFLFSLAQEWLFAWRRNSEEDWRFIIKQVLEDSTSLLDPARDRETPGGVSLLAQHLDLGREMGLGILAICHSLGQISPKILHSVESFFACSLRGDNLGLAQQVLGITRSQADFLRVNPIGTACALVPSVWPRSVLLAFPRVQGERR